MGGLTRHRVEANGATFEVLRGDHEGPVVCVQHPHTFGLESFEWLAEETGFVYVNIRGQEGSTPVRESADLTTQRAVEDLDAVRQELGIGRWVILGGSAGSQVALTYALTFPQSLSGLVSYVGFAGAGQAGIDPGSVCSPQHPAHQAGIHALMEARPSRLPTVLPGNRSWARIGDTGWGLFEGDELLLVMPGDRFDDRYRAVFEEAVDFDVADRLPEIDVPTLVVGGRHDQVVPVEGAIAVHKGIAHSRLVILEHSGHGAEGDDEEIFRGAVRRLLADV